MAKGHEAKGVCVGMIGTRQGASDKLMRKLQAKGTALTVLAQKLARTVYFMFALYGEHLDDSPGAVPFD